MKQPLSMNSLTLIVIVLLTVGIAGCANSGSDAVSSTFEDEDGVSQEDGEGQTENEEVSYVVEPPPLPTLAVESPAWEAHACFIKNDKTLWCWGSNGRGELGDGTGWSKNTAVQEESKSENWLTVAAGTGYSCAIKENGTLWCWGDYTGGLPGGQGVLGVKSRRPVLIGHDTDWRSISLTHRHACAIKTSGELYCWGLNEYGQLGNGTSDDEGELSQQTSPVQEVTHASDWISVSTSMTTTCAVKEGGSIWCWGKDYIINGPPSDKVTVPTKIGTDLDWIDIVADNNAACGMKANGSVWCWGESNGLYPGESYGSEAPFEIDWENQWMRLANSGSAGFCAITAEGFLWCWGRQQASSEEGWLEVASAYTFICVRKDDDSVWCKGSNVFGQLGDGTNEDSPNVFVKVQF